MNHCMALAFLTLAATLGLLASCGETHKTADGRPVMRALRDCDAETGVCCYYYNSLSCVKVKP